jgi:hypothetical protein
MPIQLPFYVTAVISNSSLIAEALIWLVLSNLDNVSFGWLFRVFGSLLIVVLNRGYIAEAPADSCWP